MLMYMMKYLQVLKLLFKGLLHVIQNHLLLDWPTLDVVHFMLFALMVKHVQTFSSDLNGSSMTLSKFLKFE